MTRLGRRRKEEEEEKKRKKKEMPKFRVAKISKREINALLTKKRKLKAKFFSVHVAPSKTVGISLNLGAKFFQFLQAGVSKLKWAHM